jgi:hypothetical protein
LERHRFAAFGLLLALTAGAQVASAQMVAAVSDTSKTTATTSDSAAKAAEAVPNFFRDIQANAFASFGYINNLNQPQDQSIGLRYFDNRANTFSADLAELVVQKAVAKPGEAGFRIDLTAGTFAGLTQSAGSASATTPICSRRSSATSRRSAAACASTPASSSPTWAMS